MKPQHDFTAERALAQHCVELLPPAPPTRDLVGGCAELGQEITRELAPYLASIGGGSELTLACGEAGRTNTTAFINRLGRKAAHWVLDIAEGAALLMSLDHEAALALTDRAYGGTGEVPDPLPDTLPLSADLTLRQLEAACRDGLARIFRDTAAPTLNRRGADLGRLDPFRGKAECIHFDLTVTQGDQKPWTIVLAASLPDMQQMIDRSIEAGPNGAPAQRHDQAPKDTTGENVGDPFAEVPLAATAMLAEVKLPLARLAALAPGDLFPLAIARQVPLQIGGTTIALGTIGAQDDRVALQITRRF